MHCHQGGLLPYLTVGVCHCTYRFLGLPAPHGHLCASNTLPSFECSNVSHLTGLTFAFHCVSVQLSACLLILSLIHYGAKHGPSWLEHFKWLAVVSIAAGLPKIAFKALIGLRHLVGCTSSHDINLLPTLLWSAVCMLSCKPCSS